MKYGNYFTYFLLILLVAILVLIIWHNCTGKEGFTALTNPPSWFPQNSAKAYNKKDWESRMYLDRYPFRYNTDEFLSQKKSDNLASVYRFWKN
jgi:hypothetical protein